MKIAITGGGGFLGQRLAREFLSGGAADIVLADLGAPRGFENEPRVSVRSADLADPKAASALVADADVIVHLAAVVSGQAEADFDIGMRVNLDATRLLLEAARAAGRRPVFVFSSSLAVFGPPLPAVLDEETAVHPQSSYGMQKAVGELLVADYSRRGFVDGRIVRLPTVCVRPGKANAAASSFVSGIIREPLAGQKAVCPVGRDLELWLSSPQAAVSNLFRAATLPASAWGDRRVVNLPGITVTVGGMIEALERQAGAEAVARIEFADVPAVRRIVASWPSRFDVARGRSLGFVQDPDFDALVRQFVAESGAEQGSPRGARPV